MRQRIRDMKVAVMNGEMVVGKLWWQKTKAMYKQGEENPEEDGLLKLEGPPPPAVYAAFRDLIANKPNRSTMRGWCLGKDELSKDECRVLIRAFKQLNVSASLDQFHTSMEMMRCLVRTTSHSQHSDIVKLGFQHYDDTLTQAFAIMKSEMSRNLGM
eukprot:1020953-Amphidinium_carterae.1